MRERKWVTCIVPARNEGQSIDRVLLGLPQWVDEILVVDNHSDDDTARAAFEHGAEIVGQGRIGYGVAAMSGIAVLRNCDVVVLIDGDFSQDPTELDRLVDPIARGEVDLVTGSRRMAGADGKGPAAAALSLGARLKIAAACLLMRVLFGARFTDIDRYRAIRREALQGLGLKEFGYGFSVEMQIQAARSGLRYREVPVSWRPRFIENEEEAAMLPPRRPQTFWRDTILPILRQRFRPAPSRALMPPERRLIVFAASPQPGEAKPALIAAMGEQGAAELQSKLTRFALWNAQPLREEGFASIEVRHESGQEFEARDWYGGSNVAFQPQGEGALGARLERAFRTAFEDGFEVAGVLLADVPDFDTRRMRAAYAGLESADVVVGPTKDGGVYWIAMQDLHAEVFEGVDSAPRADSIVKRAEELGLSVAILDALTAIEAPESLSLWEEIDQKARGTGAPSEGGGKPEEVMTEPKRLLRF